MLNHFKQEDQKQAESDLACMRYCALQMIRNMEEGNVDVAKSFKNDLNLFYTELERKAKKKQEEDQLYLLVGQINGQTEIDRLKERFNV